MKLNDLDKLVEKIRLLIPDDGQKVVEEVRSSIKAVLVSGLKDMDLVTREEFDIQTKLLARTRAKLDELQAQMDKLEQSSG